MNDLKEILARRNQLAAKTKVALVPDATATVEVFVSTPPQFQLVMKMLRGVEIPERIGSPSPRREIGFILESSTINGLHEKNRKKRVSICLVDRWKIEAMSLELYNHGF
ncbi:hypothetical protein QL285_027998 [Trifolium repens]|nr:hypothetical protein QL285_027998 [Trifolium repens]